MIDEAGAQRLVVDACFTGTDADLADAIRRDVHPAHYTTAENALNILSGGSIWLRTAAVMNDFREVEWGSECVKLALHGSAGQPLKAIVNGIKPGGYDELLETLEDGEFARLRATFLCSYSEHGPLDGIGRLSMWRAYGGATAGVALVFERAVALEEDNATPLVTYSKVLYASPEQYRDHFLRRVLHLRQVPEAVRQAGAKFLLDNLRRALTFDMLCTKHPGFEDEREWRVLWSPEVGHALPPQLGVCIRGVPQVVLNVPLVAGEDKESRAQHLGRLLRRIIIGPCQHPQVIAQAFHYNLQEMGIEDPGAKISISHIPLRQPG